MCLHGSIKESFYHTSPTGGLKKPPFKDDVDQNEPMRVRTEVEDMHPASFLRDDVLENHVDEDENLITHVNLSIKGTHQRSGSSR